LRPTRIAHSSGRLLALMASESGARNSVQFCRARTTPVRTSTPQAAKPHHENIGRTKRIVRSRKASGFTTGTWWKNIADRSCLRLALRRSS
jgi:hypothetical protein